MRKESQCATITLLHRAFSLFEKGGPARRNYRERYGYNVKLLIGGIQLADVKPMHCKTALNQPEEKYAGSTIRQTCIAMEVLFKAAKMDDLIAKHPMDGVRFTKPTRAVNGIRFLTVEEQKKPLTAAQKSHNCHQLPNRNAGQEQQL